MENPRPEEEKIIKDVRNLIRLEKLKEEAIGTTIKGIRNFLRLEKGNKAIKDKILRNIRNVLRLEKEDKAMKDIILGDNRNPFANEEEENYYKQVRVSNFWSNNYIEYESNNHRNKTLSAEEYPDKIRPYLKDIINNLKKSEVWKIQLTKAINFFYSIDNDEECVMHSKSDNIEIMMNDEADPSRHMTSQGPQGELHGTLWGSTQKLMI